MENSRQRKIRTKTGLSTGTVAGGAIIWALCGVPAPVLAQAAVSNPAADKLPDIVVTATRRTQSLESVPYSLSVVSAQQLAQTGVTDLASLALQVPGLSMYDYGARSTAATVPIIRGINATGEPIRTFRTFEQAPVGTYIGNSPVDGYVPFDDLKQVEVLRGPQGTLYGAGALGGALRLIPNDPQLNAFHVSVEGSGGIVAHSKDASYTASGMINVPIGDTLAFRASTKYAYDAGFVDAYGLLETGGSGVTAIPVLANPVGSSPVYNSKRDWNFQKSLTSRASLLWQPTDTFHAEAAYLYAKVNGDGGPEVNPDYAGGTSPLDPNTTLPAGGKYSEFAQIDEPFTRHTQLLSLDASYDAGFATLSSTTSYYKTSGSTLEDDTYDLAGVAGGAYLAYYAGVPTNPRFVYDQVFTDRAHTFTQEVRLVSKPGSHDVIDYVLGGFYENQTRNGAWTIAVPGSPERSVAQGCTSQAYTGASYPDCLVIANPNDINFQQIDTQHFTDKSVFGELTWHYLPHAQLTFGGRHFWQNFTDAQSYQDFTFPTYIPASPHNSSTSGNIFKVGTSYEYTTGHNVYALWSQGFRRGGANSVPLTGIFQESPLLATYRPDKTNNYEVGLKGRFSSIFNYSFDLFYIDWNKPQISASLPSGNLAVYNANTATSKGFEFESSGNLPIRGLSYSVSAAYADAKLTSAFALPGNNGKGVIVPGLISGKSGQQLPGSPKFSASVNLQYFRHLAPDYDLTLSLNGVYRSAVTLGLANSLGTTVVQKSSDYKIANLYTTIRHKSWLATFYVKNLLDKQEILAPPTQVNQLDNLTDDYIVNRPREIGIKLAYSY